MNGIINFLKPPGMSSNGAVVFMRGLLGIKKTGHAGTLDPGACGVLPICVGKATKISSYMMGGRKEYIAEVTFGKRTDTADSYGAVVDTSSAQMPSEDDVKGVLSRFCGQISQQAPAYSAVKHEGRKLYQLARKGIEIAPKIRNVVIYEINYLAQMREDVHLIRVVCGKGTYIRTLCEDIAKALGTLAYMSFLVRSSCAGLGVDDAVTIDELKELGDRRSEVLLPIDMFLGGLPKMKVDACHRRVLFNGGSVAHVDNDAHEDAQENICIFIGDELLGIGKIEEGLIKISTLLVAE